MPIFSVIIPTFNCSKCLKKSLGSVLKQTFVDFEVLVMDDGSNDGTHELIKRYRDRRIKYEWFPNSGRPATPRNHGLDRAKGKWISFLDADDLWLPKKLEIVSKLANKIKGVDAICHDEMLYYGSNKIKRLRHGPYVKDFYRVLLLGGNRCSTSAMTVKRKFIEKHNIRFNESRKYIIVEDYDFWLRMAAFGAKYFFINDTLGIYVIRPDSISKNETMLRQNRKSLLRDHVFKIQEFEENKNKLWRQLVARLSIYDTISLCKKKRYFDAAYRLMCGCAPTPSGCKILGSMYINRKIQQWIQRT